MKKNDYRVSFILVGASGSGKSTMASILEEQLGLRRCITCTTRPPRPGERDGVDYHFRTHLNPEEMFEYASFGGYEYGVTREELTRGDFIILEPQGVSYYREHYPAPVTVIQLERTGIQIDAARRNRDRAAGFDNVNPDIIIRGETIAETTKNLLKAVNRLKKSLPVQIDAARKQQTLYSSGEPSNQKEYAR